MLMSSRLLPEARKAAFTRANCVRGFEQTGIYPFNRDALPVMQKHHQAQRDAAAMPSTPLRQRSHSLPSSPFTPLTNIRRLLALPPDSPTKLQAGAKALADAFEAERANRSFLQGRLQELTSHDKEKDKPDRRRPKGKSRVFTVAVLTQMRDERNALAAQKAARGSRGRGRPRGSRATRGRGVRASGRGGRGSGKMLINFDDGSGSDDSELTENLVESDNEVDMQVDEVSDKEESVGEERPRREGLRPRKI